MSLTIEHMSDRELLMALNDVADPEGWATPKQIATRLNLNGNGTPRSVACRFAWLTRYGALERDVRTVKPTNGRSYRETRWRFTKIGEAMALGSLSGRELTLIENLGNEKLVSLTRAVAARQRASAPTAAHLMRREYRYGTSKLRG